MLPPRRHGAAPTTRQQPGRAAASSSTHGASAGCCRSSRHAPPTAAASSAYFIHYHAAAAVAASSRRPRCWHASMHHAAAAPLPHRRARRSAYYGCLAAAAGRRPCLSSVHQPHRCWPDANHAITGKTIIKGVGVVFVPASGLVRTKKMKKGADSKSDGGCHCRSMQGWRRPSLVHVELQCARRERAMYRKQKGRTPSAPQKTSRHRITNEPSIRSSLERNACGRGHKSRAVRLMPQCPAKRTFVRSGETATGAGRSGRVAAAGLAPAAANPSRLARHKEEQNASPPRLREGHGARLRLLTLATSVGRCVLVAIFHHHRVDVTGRHSPAGIIPRRGSIPRLPTPG